MPAARRNFSVLICTALPMPTEPNEIEPGLALASAIKSCMVLQGRAFGTIITLALEPIISAEARSLTGSKARFGKIAGAIVSAVLDHDRLAEFNRQTVEQHPRHDIGRAAGAERNRRLDQPRRPVLRLCMGANKKARQYANGPKECIHQPLRFVRP